MIIRSFRPLGDWKKDCSVGAWWKFIENLETLEIQTCTRDYYQRSFLRPPKPKYKPLLRREMSDKTKHFANTWGLPDKELPATPKPQNPEP